MDITFCSKLTAQNVDEIFLFFEVSSTADRATPNSNTTSRENLLRGHRPFESSTSLLSPLTCLPPSCWLSIFLLTLHKLMLMELWWPTCAAGLSKYLTIHLKWTYYVVESFNVRFNSLFEKQIVDYILRVVSHVQGGNPFSTKINSAECNVCRLFEYIACLAKKVQL